MYAEGLVGPMGLEVDHRGWLWIAGHGTAKNDSDVSMVTPDGNVHSFITGLPSTWINVPFGANHVYFDDAGNLVILVGTGRDPMAESLLLVDTTEFKPGDGPLGAEAAYTFLHLSK